MAYARWTKHLRHVDGLFLTPPNKTFHLAGLLGVAFRTTKDIGLLAVVWPIFPSDDHWDTHDNKEGDGERRALQIFRQHQESM